MRKILSLLAIVMLFVGCKKEVVEEPDRLIAKGKMIDIMYDMAILEASKFQSSAISEDYSNNPSEYIYKKYKVDSLQLAQSNIYYASDYIEYEEMFQQINKRITTQKTRIDSILKIEKKKEKKRNALKLAKAALKKKDSLSKIKKKIALKKKDSLALKKKDSLLKVKKKSELKKKEILASKKKDSLLKKRMNRLDR
jgi:hypothetical protein